MSARARAQDVEERVSTEVATRRRRGPVPLKTYLTRVRRVERITLRMHRVTIGGGDLEGFVSAAADQFITLILPQPGQERPAIDPDTFSWELFRAMPEAIRPIARNYTARRHRPAAAEIDVDVVLHGDSGPASNWALGAQTGDHLAIWGPRTAYAPPAGTAWQLLCADETGLPAAAAILEDLAPGDRALAFIEIADRAEEQPLRSAGDVTVTWLHRDGIPPGESDLLVEAIRRAQFPAGPVYAWGGAERGIMAAVRQHLREERGVANDAISFLNYWRRGELHG
jgi:NADPH-dependent ferric siderophore reductase